ncbi:MAG TPA: SDR family oxidoreductase [Candidatus Sulfotelmatobacter sp.]|nr:SDR family oxidoreductase [Candidatus Sulfotelmatobacter sp.]
MSVSSNVLITGASGGLGYEFAKLFARDRHNLILVARSADKLAHVAKELQAVGVTVKTFPLDLGESPAPKFLYDQLQREGVSVEILVNNAGFGAYGEFAQMDEKEIRGQIHLNVTALTELTRLFLPAMIERGSGRIMNVASTAGFQPGPLMAVYYATKAYVISFSEAIANEVKDSGVTVTCFCPGATQTGFAERAGNDKTRVFKRAGVMAADKVALDGYRAVMEGRTLAISGLQNWLVAQSTRLAPRRLVTALSRWVSEPPDRKTTG